MGDLTHEKVDTIVNAANNYLDHAGTSTPGAARFEFLMVETTAGLAGAIVRNGGRVIQDESDAIVRRMGRLQTGDVVPTSAGRLPCKACDLGMRVLPCSGSDTRWSVESAARCWADLEGWPSGRRDVSSGM
jgi:O-acetyl-ADP-ribose deacetylase (regulator of RNase III)